MGQRRCHWAPILTAAVRRGRESGFADLATGHTLRAALAYVAPRAHEAERAIRTERSARIAAAKAPILLAERPPVDEEDGHVAVCLTFGTLA